MMQLEICPGPLGTDGGEPFPEVGKEMEMMAKGARFFRPWLMRLIPQKFLMNKIREKMGAPNKDIAKGKVESRLLQIPGPNGDIPIHVSKPEGEGLPIMLFFHGGGWFGGSVGQVENICRGIADRAGYVAINVDYRLAPEHKFPAGLEDCYAAVEWAAKHGEELGGDPARIVVAGDSAGGNFATVCCLLAHERGGPKISHQVLIYPVVDVSGRYEEECGPEANGHGMDMSFISSLYTDDSDLMADPRVSPWVIEDLSFMPPAMVMTAEYCFIRDQGEAFGNRLAKAGVRTRVIRYNGLNHAYLDKIGVWSYADRCIDHIVEDLPKA
jgi:acetyl esterase